MSYRTLDPQQLKALNKIIDTELGWSVVSALRGPDFNSGAPLKGVTTNVLRHFVGMSHIHDCAEVSSPSKAMAGWKALSSTTREETVALYKGNYHFGSHFTRAMRVLGPEAVDYMEWWLGEVECL